MKVTDHIKQSKGTSISFEILPPLKGKTIESIYNHLNSTNTATSEWTYQILDICRKRIALAGYRLANAILSIYK